MIHSFKAVRYSYPAYRACKVIIYAIFPETGYILLGYDFSICSIRQTRLFGYVIIFIQKYHCYYIIFSRKRQHHAIGRQHNIAAQLFIAFSDHSKIPPQTHSNLYPHAPLLPFRDNDMNCFPRSFTHFPTRLIIIRPTSPLLALFY